MKLPFQGPPVMSTLIRVRLNLSEIESENENDITSRCVHILSNFIYRAAKNIKEYKLLSRSVSVNEPHM